MANDELHANYLLYKIIIIRSFFKNFFKMSSIREEEQRFEVLRQNVIYEMPHLFPLEEM